jgi:hypothetical protein
LIPGCGGKPAWQNKNRMGFDISFSKFAARLREFMRGCEGELRSNNEGLAPTDVGGYEEEFNPLALELFGMQFEYNGPYRRFCEARGVLPGSVGSWKEIPAVPTSAFKEFELTCLPVEKRIRVFHSSGTTEQRPSRHFHSAESLAVYEASCWSWFERQLRGQRTEVRLVILTPGPEEAPHSSLVHMFETVRARMGADSSVFVGRVGADGSWRLDFEAALRSLEDERPIVLLGTAFSFVHLLDYLGEQELSFKLRPGSRVMETGGYKGRSRTLPKGELHRLITRRLGIPEAQIVCEYGMSELGSQAYDRGARGEGRGAREFRFPPWARVQIISPETGKEVEAGETGLIRVFDLANVYSVMAIETEDLGMRRGGGGFELIGRAELAEARGCSLMVNGD